MVALVAATSALEMLSDLLPVSSLNSQDKLARCKQRRLRLASGAPGAARSLRATCASTRCQTAVRSTLDRIAALVAPPVLIRTGGTQQHGKLSYRILRFAAEIELLLPACEPLLTFAASV